MLTLVLSLKSLCLSHHISFFFYIVYACSFFVFCFFWNDIEHIYRNSESKQSHLCMCFDYGRLFKVF